jgi:RimJ/RimL family protein N-acetyltransferase
VNTIATALIRTPRLILIPLSAGHAAEMAGVLADPDLYAFTGGGPPTEAELRGRYERWAAGSPEPAVTWCNWAIELRADGRLAGTVQATISTGPVLADTVQADTVLADTVQADTGLADTGLADTGLADTGLADTGLAAEIAWIVGSPWQGRGIATEAARALVAWLGQQSVRTVIAHIHPEHAASAAVAAAAGLVPTGELHDGEQRWRRMMTP